MGWEYCEYSWTKAGDDQLELPRQDVAVLRELTELLGPGAIRSDQDRPNWHIVKGAHRLDVFRLLGAHGWELVTHSVFAHSGGFYTFKRPIEVQRKVAQ
jgi:hypothetical protein